MKNENVLKIKYAVAHFLWMIYLQSFNKISLKKTSKKITFTLTHFCHRFWNNKITISPHITMPCNV